MLIHIKIHSYFIAAFVGAPETVICCAKRSLHSAQRLEDFCHGCHNSQHSASALNHRMFYATQSRRFTWNFYSNFADFFKGMAMEERIFSKLCKLL